MAKSKVGVVVEMVTPRVYKVWTEASEQQLAAIGSVVSVVPLGGDLYVVTMRKRCSVNDVVAEVRRLGGGEGCDG